MFLAVGLGCVSLEGPAGLLLLSGSVPGLLERVRRKVHAWERRYRPGWGSLLPCKTMLDFCLAAMFSQSLIPNKICLSPELKAFCFEGKSSLKDPGGYS